LAADTDADCLIDSIAGPKVQVPCHSDRPISINLLAVATNSLMLLL